MKKGKVKKLMSITLTAAMIGTSYIPAYAEESQPAQTAAEEETVSDDVASAPADEVNSGDEQTTTDDAPQADDSQENQDETVENPVAEVNGTQYATVQEAVSAATVGQTVTLTADATEDVTIPAGKDIVLDLNGKTLTNTNAGKATLSVQGTAYVKNGSIVGGTKYYNIAIGTIDGNDNIVTSGTVTLEEVTAKAGNAGSAMIDVCGSLTIKSGTYTGGLDVVKNEPNSNLKIENGSFELKDQANGYTGVIYNYGQLLIEDGIFVQNSNGVRKAQQVIVNGKGKVGDPLTIVNGGTFTNNSTSINAKIFHHYTPAPSSSFQVKGGTFSKTLSASYIAPGYKTTGNVKNGTYCVIKADEAQIGTQKYKTLKEAVEAAKNGETIKLLTNVSLTEGVYINDKSITLNMNGKKIVEDLNDEQTTYGILTVYGTGKLDITGNGTFDYTSNYYNNAADIGGVGYLVTVMDNAEVTVENGTFNGAMGCIRLGRNRNATGETAKVYIKGGEFTSKVLYNNHYWTLNMMDGTTTEFVITGGKFNAFNPSKGSTENPEQDWVAEDYEAVDDGNGNYTVTAIDYYQKLQDTITTAEAIKQGNYSDLSYKALQDAIAKAKEITEEASKDELKEAIKAITDATDDLKEASITVSVSCNPDNSGILTGGGKYASGESATVTAKAVDGYKFVGWYNGDTKVSDDTTYEVTPEEGVSEYNLTAKYTSNDSKNLVIKVGEGTVNYKYERDTKGATISEDLNAGYPMGSRFTVTATPKDGYTFLYWINSEGRILSNSETYSFYLGYDMTVQACYKEKAEESHVVFKDMNGRVLWSGDSKKGEVSVPKLKVYDGFEFKGWIDSATKEQVADKDTEAIKVEKDMTIYADYESLKGLTVTVDGIQQEKTYEYANLVKVTADESRDGKYFSGWYSDGKQVSQELEYSFYITENTSLTAEYNGDDVLEKSVLLNMDMSERTTLSNGKESVVMKVTWDIPEGYSLVQGGLIRTLNDDYKDKLTLENVDGTNVKKNVSKLASSNGTYLYTLTLATTARTKNLHAVGYVTYRNNTTGEVKTIYTNLNTANGASN